MKIEIINVQSTTKPTKNGSYTQLEVAFKNLDSGKVEGKKIMSFTNKDVFSVLSKANSGEAYDVSTQKNESSGYWDWVKVTPMQQGQETMVQAKTFTSPKSTYETPEERALRQVYIIKQSSISNAIETLKTDKNQPNPEEVLKVAQVYFDWVMNKPTPTIADLDDDIPL